MKKYVVLSKLQIFWAFRFFDCQKSDGEVILESRWWIIENESWYEILNFQKCCIRLFSLFKFESFNLNYWIPPYFRIICFKHSITFYPKILLFNLQKVFCPFKNIPGKIIIICYSPFDGWCNNVLNLMDNEFWDLFFYILSYILAKIFEIFLVLQIWSANLLTVTFLIRNIICLYKICLLIIWLRGYLGKHFNVQLFLSNFNSWNPYMSLKI